jgi:hypothetical protein
MKASVTGSLVDEGRGMFDMMQGDYSVPHRRCSTTLRLLDRSGCSPATVVLTKQWPCSRPCLADLRPSPAVTRSSSANRRFCAKDRKRHHRCKRGAAPATTRIPSHSRSRQFAPATGRSPRAGRRCAGRSCALDAAVELFPADPWSSVLSCP